MVNNIPAGVRRTLKGMKVAIFPSRHALVFIGDNWRMPVDRRTTREVWAMHLNAQDGATFVLLIAYNTDGTIQRCVIADAAHPPACSRKSRR